jgi:hypothetical protein
LGKWGILFEGPLTVGKPMGFWGFGEFFIWGCNCQIIMGYRFYISIFISFGPNNGFDITKNKTLRSELH